MLKIVHLHCHGGGAFAEHLCRANAMRVSVCAFAPNLKSVLRKSLTLLSMDSLCSRFIRPSVAATLASPHNDDKASTDTSVSSGNQPNNK